MYLLFTFIISIALIIGSALDIHRAFKTVEDGLVISSQTAMDRNKLLHDSVMQTAPFAMQQQLLSISVVKEDYINYLTRLKEILISQGGGLDEATGIINDADNTTISTELFVTNHEADTLSNKMLALSNVMQSIASNDSAKRYITALLSTRSIDNNWAKHTFEHVPLTATVTILSKFENDVYDAEQILLKDILNSQPLSSKPATAQ